MAGPMISAIFLGGEFINIQTFARVMALHIILPFMIILGVVAHIIILH